MRCPEIDFSFTAVYSADVAFITGTHVGIIPLMCVDGRRIGGSTRGTVARNLQERHHVLVEREKTQPAIGEPEESDDDETSSPPGRTGRPGTARLGTRPAGSSGAIDPSLLTLERIFEASEFAPERQAIGAWSPDGSGYVRGGGAGRWGCGRGVRRGLWRRAGGYRFGRTAGPGRRGEPPRLESYSWSEDGSTWLLRTATGEWWTLHRPTGRLAMVEDGHDEELSRATLSPGGDRIAYVVRNDLYVQDLATSRVVRLTTDGSATILNGTTEGVYVGLNAGGFRWSPDGTRIAFLRFEAEGRKAVPHHQLHRLRLLDGAKPSPRETR